VFQAARMGDMEVEMLEQQRLIEQLKAMIRDRDDEVSRKDKELTVSSYVGV